MLLFYGSGHVLETPSILYLSKGKLSF